MGVCLCELVFSISHLTRSRHTHLVLSLGSTNTVPLARTWVENKILSLAGLSQLQKNSMFTCSNRSQVIFSLSAFGECSVILHLFYNSERPKVSSVAMTNIHMLTYIPIPNLKNFYHVLAYNIHLISASSSFSSSFFLTPWNSFRLFNYLIKGFGTLPPAKEHCNTSSTACKYCGYLCLGKCVVMINNPECKIGRRWQICHMSYRVN